MPDKPQAPPDDPADPSSSPAGAPPEGATARPGQPATPSEAATPKKKHAGGRPRWWTGKIGAEREAKLFKAFATGSPVWAACEYAGIGESAFYDRQAADPKFMDRVKRACSEPAILCLGVIQREALGIRALGPDGQPERGADGKPTGRWIKEPNWFAAARLLEGRFPADFARRVVSVKNEGGKPFQISAPLAAMPDDVVKRELTEVLAAIAKDLEDDAPAAPTPSTLPS